jgi:hypothetical protein
MTTEPAPDPALLDRLQSTLDAGGALAAVDALCSELEAAGDFQNLFYARLMRKRVELGASPFPTGPASELPDNLHEAYENAIRQAGREVGGRYLECNDIPRAWPFFRMLGEPDPVRAAIAAYRPGPDDDTYPVVEIAWQHGVYPEKGFDLVLDRNGVCSAITMVHSSDLSQNESLRTYCVQQLVRALHAQLVERLRTDLESRGVTVPADATVESMIAGREELFADDGYHIDTSHLSAVVQLALHLPRCPELELARELALYGSQLAPGLRGDNDPPFEGTYADYRVYLEVLAGKDLESGLAHFRRKAEQGMADGYQFPAEVLINLLLKAGRPEEALEVASQYLRGCDERQLSCPGLTELARQNKDYGKLIEVARDRADPVMFVAGLIAQSASQGRVRSSL